MNHPFDPNKENKTLCAKCNFDYMAHTPFAICADCKRVGSHSVYARLNLLLCDNCHGKRTDEFIHEHTQIINDNKTKRIVEDAKKIDTSIQYSADLFNAKTVPIIEIKKAIDADDSIENKHFAYQNALIERYEHLSKVIFKADNVKYEATLEKIVIGKTLREFGAELRLEMRERIKQSDAQYEPPVKKQVKTPKIKEVKKDPITRMAEALALMKNVTIKVALEMIKQGMKK